MLKTNTKKARQNVQAYIMDGFNGDNYGIETSETFKEAARIIYDIFKSEKFYTDAYARAHGMTEQTSFIDWCAGLPSIIDTCYYYNRSAVDDLGAILEETEAEKKSFYRDRSRN